MRTFISFLLVMVLVACPELCRVGSLACCADHCEESGAPDDDSKAPAAPDNEAVSCICAGAVKDSSRLFPLVAGAPRLAHDATLLSIDPPYLSPCIELVRYGAPQGRSPTGPHRLHLVLQTFRC